MSRSTNKLILLSVAGLLAWALAESAQAQVVVNGAGSSAGRQFAGGAPIALCNPGSPAFHFRSGTTDTNSNLHTWTCTATLPGLGATPVVVRYSASESGDGFVKLTGQGGAATTALYIEDASTCPGAGVPRTVAGLTFTEFSSCSASAIPLPVHFGASDVLSGSFDQSGPTGNSFADPALSGPAGTIVQNATDVVAALPFAFFVNNAVRLLDAGGNPGATQLNNLDRAQVEGIFRRNVRNWEDLGYGVSGGQPGITLCLREAGSGTKAALDQAIMLQSTEAVVANNTANGTGGSVIYSPTSGGVVTCVQNNPGAIGYLNAESVVANAHPINFAGYSANYPTGTTFERKRDLACGRYEFWTFWRLIRKTAGANLPTADQDNLITLFRDAAKNEVNSVPSGTHWAAISGSVPNEMKVTKSADAGPISWVTVAGVVPAHPECRP